jgi:hypothetical protein
VDKLLTSSALAIIAHQMPHELLGAVIMCIAIGWLAYG